MAESAEEKKPLLAGDEFRENGIIGKHIYIMSHYSDEAMLLLYYDDVDLPMKIIISIFSEQNVSNIDSQDGHTSAPQDRINITADGTKSNSVTRALGVVLVITAGMCFTGSNIIQKFVVPEVTFWQLLVTRAIIQTVLLGTTCLIMHYKFRSGRFL